MTITEEKYSELLRIISDPTRRKILQLLSEEMNPQEIADSIKISRPAVEKHLKIMLENDLVEKLVQGFPKPRFVYATAMIAHQLLNRVDEALFKFISSRIGILNANYEELERKFISGTIKEEEYRTKKVSFEMKLKDLENMSSTKAYIDEVKKIISEHETQND